MHSVNSHAAPLPTGSWLAQERQRLGRTMADVARAVRGHSATVRSVEQNNRVIPPGWYADLRALGVQIHEPVWPAQMPPYLGSDLNRDIRTQPGLEPSRFWLSKQLCVPESAVAEVIRGGLPVPHSWLLKLAELNASVPAQVRMMLRPYVSGTVAPLLDPAGAWTPSSPPRRLDETATAAQPAAVHSASPSPRSLDPAAPGESPVRRERSSIYFHWTEDGGLHFSISASLLEKIPDLLIRLHESGLLGPKAGHSKPEQGA